MVSKGVHAVLEFLIDDFPDMDVIWSKQNGVYTCRIECPESPGMNSNQFSIGVFKPAKHYRNEHGSPGMNSKRVATIWA
ncbi:hypothetical protein Bca52824_033858 [Brassica carinata]|uniref:Uncharacterized protein n=1 Tax=Brassica carinata TaxID=52824 RepID=A0A8X7V7R8_BRACI|nr:hypothetical protein Bca52824_033858 [Brassica carinata]